MLWLRTFILEDTLKIVLKSEQYSAHSIELKRTTLKTKVTTTRFLRFITVPMSFSSMQMCQHKYLNWLSEVYGHASVVLSILE